MKKNKNKNEAHCNRLYSVYMTESELKMFSERSKAGWKEA